MRRVLIANRGEIAVRLLRACRDAGLAGIAVYADQDRDAPHARLADEAYALGGRTAAETYLDIGGLIGVARTAGADAVHPGYGFLSENAEFAQAVLDAGLVWIGPPPDAIRRLGDKVQARRIADRAGAPSVPGTPDPVGTAAEIQAFADEHGLPVAIKAAYGGGGRGLKVARAREEIPELFDAAVREAEAGFGRGECFVERYLDRARHIETQCLADRHGRVAVVSTRDCTLQRRHQKLVEEAPAPFLTEEQEERVREASQAVLAEAGYIGAGTCEFLLGEDGTLSFLEVNTRLQVEHPVTEEVTGVDLVAEQFRLAEGEPLGYARVPVRGHALEFRINGEDAGRGFLPAPGTVTRWSPPSGPGVRLDSGVEEGAVVDGAFDSMLAKLIVTGRTREEALRRARRALGEFEVGGVATVLPFHRAVVGDPAFTAPGGDRLGVHTRWIEEDFDNRIAPAPPPAPPSEPPDGGGTDGRGGSVVVEVGRRRVEVVLPAGWPPGGASAPARAARGAGSGRAPGRSGRAARGKAAGADGPGLVSPMQGSVVSVAVTEGQRVEAGDTVAVLEAMKMEHPVSAHRSGTVTALCVEEGAAVSQGAAICEIRE